MVKALSWFTGDDDKDDWRNNWRRIPVPTFQTNIPKPVAPKPIKPSFVESRTVNVPKPAPTPQMKTPKMEAPKLNLNNLDPFNTAKQFQPTIKQPTYKPVEHNPITSDPLSIRLESQKSLPSNPLEKELRRIENNQKLPVPYPLRVPETNYATKFYQSKPSVMESAKANVEAEKAAYDARQAQETEKVLRAVTLPVRGASQGITTAIAGIPADVISNVGNIGDIFTEDTSDAGKFFANMQSGGANMSNEANEFLQNVFQTAKDTGVIKDLSTGVGQLLVDIASGSTLAGLRQANIVFNDSYNFAKVNGASDLESFSKATANAVVQYLIEKSSMDMLLNPVAKTAITKAISGMITEGSEEGLQSLIDNITKWSNNNQIDIWDGVGYEAILGAILGGGASAVVSNVDGIPTKQSIDNATNEVNNVLKATGSDKRVSQDQVVNYIENQQVAGGGNINENENLGNAVIGEEMPTTAVNTQIIPKTQVTNNQQPTTPITTPIIEPITTPQLETMSKNVNKKQVIAEPTQVKTASPSKAIPTEIRTKSATTKEPAQMKESARPQRGEQPTPAIIKPIKDTKTNEPVAEVLKAPETGEVTVDAPQVTKTPTDMLKQEALKYKSAEEFVKSKTPSRDYVTVYHNTNTPIEDFGKTPIFSKENRNEFFVSNKKDGQISGYGKNTLELRVRKSDLDINDEFPSGEKHYTINTAKVDKYLKDKQQLIDIYNQAHAEANTPQVTKTAKPAPNTKPAEPTLAPIKSKKTPKINSRYGTLDEFKDKYQVGIEGVQRLKRDANGSEFWGKDMQLSKTVKNNGIYSVEGLYKHLNNQTITMPGEAPAKPKRKYARKKSQSKLAPVGAMETAKTGEIGKSKGKFSKGQKYEKTSRAASAGRGAIEAEKTSFDKFINNIDEKGTLDAIDRDTAVEMQKKYDAGSAEHQLLGDIVNKVHTQAAQIMATIKRTIRNRSTAKQLTDKFSNKIYKILDDDRVITKEDFKPVQEKNRIFEIARDAKEKAYNKFQANPSTANMKAFEKANDDFIKADIDSLFEEYNTLAKVIKKGKTKNTDAKAYLETLRENSGIYFMDYVDANMLSSTRTMINNYINSMTVSLEESAFGKVGAAVARKLVPDAEIGGGSAVGRRIGKKVGWEQTKTEARLRQKAYGNKFLNTLSNIVTTGNTLGDRNISATAYSAVYDAYKNNLKQKGFEGKELDRRARVMTMADPDGLVQPARDQAMVNVGLAGSFQAGNKARMKLETAMADKLSGMMSTVIGDKAGKVAAKVVTRVTVGFPTVTVRSAIGGAKRTTAPLLGGVSTIQAVSNVVKKGDPNVTAMHIKNAVKEAGSGTTMIALGAALGAAGLISGGYPDDEDEKEAWKREGKSEYSIKLGGNWYNLPQALGVFALPFMVGANAMENVKNGDGILKDIIPTTWETLLNLTPAEQLKSTIELLNDIKEASIARFGSSVVRALTPFGSFINQVAKMFDPTVNDTTKGDIIAQFLAKVKDGIPGLANTLEDKEVGGNKIYNPDPIARLMGAISKEQSAGVQKTNEIRAELDAVNKQLTDNGVFTDNIRNILDDDTQVLFDRVKDKKDIDESDTIKLLNGITKGITKEGDTRFLEDEDYDSNLAVLKTKRSMLAADPTTTKDTLNTYDLQIRRGEVYKSNKIPYRLISSYKDITLTEWRELYETNPSLYKELYDLDTMMAKADSSRSSKSTSDNKYYWKSGSGGSGSGSASAKASAKAMLDAIKGKPVPELPNAPKVVKAIYRPVPVATSTKKSAQTKYGPIKVSAKSVKSNKDRSLSNVL